MYWWQLTHGCLLKCASSTERVVPASPTEVAGAGIPGGGGGMASQSTCSRTSFPRSTDDGSVVCACVARTLPLVRIPARFGIVVRTYVVVPTAGSSTGTPVWPTGIALLPAPLP